MRRPREFHTDEIAGLSLERTGMVSPRSQEESIGSSSCALEPLATGTNDGDRRCGSS